MQTAELMIIYGKPYSGKSTIAAGLAGTTLERNVRHLSMGDRLRDISAGRTSSVFQNSLIANQANLKQHTAVPNEVVFGVFEEFLSTPADLVVVDGFPRYADQLNSFRSKIQSLGASLLAICKVEVSDTVVYTRSQMRDQRFHDVEENREFVEKRLAEYRHNTLPTLDALATDYPYYQLDGEDEIPANIAALRGIFYAHTLHQK